MNRPTTQYCTHANRMQAFK